MDCNVTGFLTSAELRTITVALTAGLVSIVTFGMAYIAKTLRTWWGWRE